jgi:hypothetical protein
VFISHAGEQKQSVVDFVREKLEKHYPALKQKVFVDEISLRGGDRAMDSIYESLSDAFAGKRAAPRSSLLTLAFICA